MSAAKKDTPNQPPEPAAAPPPAASAVPLTPQASEMPPMLMADDGQPFNSEADARQHQILRRVPGQYVPRAWGSGWALVDVTRIQDYDRAQIAQRPNDPALAPGQKYHWLRFHGKRYEDDFSQVRLCVEGKWLIFDRDRDVVVPDCYREAADHCRAPEYKALPGQPLKHKGYMLRFPYNYVREATREEYVASVAVGNQRRDQVLAGAAG